MAKVLTKTFKESSAVVGTIVGYNNNLIYSISGTTLYALNLLTGVSQTITANLDLDTTNYTLKLGNGFYENGSLFIPIHYNTSTVSLGIYITEINLTTFVITTLQTIALTNTYKRTMNLGVQLYNSNGTYYLTYGARGYDSTVKKTSTSIGLYSGSSVDSLTAIYTIDNNVSVSNVFWNIGAMGVDYNEYDIEYPLAFGATVRYYNSSTLAYNSNTFGSLISISSSRMTFKASSTYVNSSLYPYRMYKWCVDDTVYILCDLFNDSSSSDTSVYDTKLTTLNLSTYNQTDVSTGLDQHTGSIVGMYGTDDTMWIFTSDGFYTLAFEEYDLNYNFVDNDGNSVASITGALPITAVNLVYEENDVAVTLTYLDGSTETINYTLPAVENKRFYGLNIIADPKSALIVEGDNSVSLSTDTTFYPVYQTYRPVGTAFELDLYQNSAESSRVDKSDYLTQVGTLSGAMRNESSITDLTILIESETVPNFNYVYIPVLNRYYYVTDITTIRYKIWQIQLQVDVLMTYHDGIRELTAFIDRNENEHNDNIIDSKRVIEQGYDVEVSTVTNELFDTAGFGTTTSFVLTGFALKGNTIPTDES